ncbi:MAG TPA: hypothetical protein VK498_08120 [Ferruginibacter sp.]|nr:hypothetical protein [Ferruginibacter sp.]
MKKIMIMALFAALALPSFAQDPCCKKCKKKCHKTGQVCKPQACNTQTGIVKS